MTFRTFFPLALVALAAPAFGQAAKQGKAVPKATAVHPPAAAAEKPLTESDLMKQLDGLRVGDPIKAQPASAPEALTEPGLPTLRTPGPAKSAAGANKAGAPAAKEQGQTEITAKEATFDSKTHQAVFTQEVMVVNPEFTVTCDKLTAFMKQGDNPAIPGAPSAGTPAATPAAGAKAGGPAAAAKSAKKGDKGGENAAGKGKSSGGLERAIAEGNVVITQDKMDDNGAVTRSVGHGRKAVYEASTGDITLTGHPDVSQGINSLESTEDSTVIILNREGRMKAIGPHKSIIRDTGSDSNSNPLSSGAGKSKSSSTTPISTPNAR